MEIQMVRHPFPVFAHVDGPCRDWPRCSSIRGSRSICSWDPQAEAREWEQLRTLAQAAAPVRRAPRRLPPAAAAPLHRGWMPLLAASFGWGQRADSPSTPAACAPASRPPLKLRRNLLSIWERSWAQLGHSWEQLWRPCGRASPLSSRALSRSSSSSTRRSHPRRGRRGGNRRRRAGRGDKGTRMGGERTRRTGTTPHPLRQEAEAEGSQAGAGAKAADTSVREAMGTAVSFWRPAASINEFFSSRIRGGRTEGRRRAQEGSRPMAPAAGQIVIITTYLCF